MWRGKANEMTGLGAKRKERNVREEAEEEGYITDPKGRRQAKNGKGSAAGTGAPCGNLLR